jgi:hypothetical protein
VKAVENELGRLFSERGVPEPVREAGDVAALRGPDITVSPGAGPRRIGTSIAQSLYGGLGRKA